MILSSTESGVIVRSDNIQDLKKFLPTTRRSNNLALALFDFDDTLVVSGYKVAGYLGGPKWRHVVLEAINELRAEKKIGANAPLFAYLTLFLAKGLKAEAVDTCIPQLTEELSKDFILKLFTARGVNNWNLLKIEGIDSLTSNQMREAGIQMTEHSGIYCSYARKHEILADLFKRKVIDPTKIGLLVYADDRDGDFAIVQELAHKYNITFVGFHYTSVNTHEVAGFDLLKSTVHLINFLATGKLLSKEEEDIELSKVQAFNNTPKEFLKDLLIELDQFLFKNNLYRPYSSVDDFYTISQVAFRTFARSLSFQFC